MGPNTLYRWIRRTVRWERSASLWGDECEGDLEWKKTDTIFHSKLRSRASACGLQHHVSGSLHLIRTRNPRSVRTTVLSSLTPSAFLSEHKRNPFFSLGLFSSACQAHEMQFAPFPLFSFVGSMSSCLSYWEIVNLTALFSQIWIHAWIFQGAIQVLQFETLAFYLSLILLSSKQKSSCGRWNEWA